MTQADTVLLNGRIFCGLAEGFVEALAIRDGKVLAAGPAAEIAALQGPGTKRVDLAGRLAIPGLNDAHMHLLPLGLGKELYAGTTSLFFTVGNATKLAPWLLLAQPATETWKLMGICLFAIPFGVWSGWRLHGVLDQRQVYRACYGLLVVTALKLLWDGMSGYLV